MAVADIIAEITSAVANYTTAGPAHARQLLSLDHFLLPNYNEEPEDTGVRLEENHLYPLVPILYRQRQSSGRWMEIVAVDSSSRLVDTLTHYIVLAAGSVTSRYKSLEIDYPSVGRGACCGRGDGYYMVLFKGEDERLLEDLESDDVSDMIRMKIENMLLGEILEVADAIPRPASILIDGPIVNGSVLAKIRDKPSKLWRDIYSERIRLVTRLESQGLAVIGVVKRFKKTSILSRSREYIGLFERCLHPMTPPSIDTALIDLAVGRGCFKWRPGSVLRSLEVRISYESGVEKLAEYLVIPGGAFHIRSPLRRVYRVEYTRAGKNILDEAGVNPLNVVLSDTLVRGALDPVTLSRSDRRAKSLSQALKKIVVSGLVTRGVALSYSTRLEVQ